MSLQDLITLSQSRKKIGISDERLAAIIPILREYISYWRDYPDMFIDFMAGPGSTFKLYFYQRVFLRASMRHKYVYATFPRAYSKSFLSVLVLMIRCILFPRANLFVTAGGKEQAAGIVKEKKDEICTLIPAFKRELDLSKGASKESKDTIFLQFKNGSTLDNIAARATTRGKRRHGGVVEEAAGIDGDVLNSVIIPTMNISRRTGNGIVDPEEVMNKSQLYITTAGWKNTFPYEKLIQILVWSIIHPEKAMVIGGTWRIPVLAGLLDKGFIEDQKNDGTFNESAYEREYESVWSGSMDDAYFTSEMFDRCRVLRQPEREASGRSSKTAYYVISMDIGRKGDTTVLCPIKVTPQSQGQSIKSLVNIHSYANMHIEDQIVVAKKLMNKYKARALVIDGTGIGINYVDLMVKNQIDPDTGDTLFGLGVINDEDGEYKKYYTSETILNSMYVIKASVGLNTLAHANIQSQLAAGRIRFLIDERDAKEKLMESKVGKAMKPDERAEYLKPFTLTSILKEEMLNLYEEQEGLNIILKKHNKKLKKDKFSSLEYGLYYIKLEEDKKNKRKGSFSDFMFMTKNN